MRRRELQIFTENKIGEDINVTDEKSSIPLDLGDRSYITKYTYLEEYDKYETSVHIEKPEKLIQRIQIKIILFFNPI